MTVTFTRATKEQAKLRLALIGPSGSGKTYTALRVAQAIGGRIALIDTEHGSASKYADEFAFDTLHLTQFSPQTYVQAIIAAAQAQPPYDVLIIDSLSHAWMGKGGALQMVDQAAKRYSNNRFAAWRDVTPQHNKLVEALIRCPFHLIATMRTKTAYEVQRDDKGKVKPVKIGLAPIQRDGFEYEFDVVGDLDLEHNLIVSKTRCRALDNAIIEKPGPDLAATLLEWLTDGATPSAPAPTPSLPTIETDPAARARYEALTGGDHNGELGRAMTEPPPANNGSPVPAILAKVRGYVAAARDKHNGRETTEQQRTNIYKKLTLDVGLDDAARHRLQEQIWGRASLKEWTFGDAAGFFKWASDKAFAAEVVAVLSAAGNDPEPPDKNKDELPH